MFYHSVLGSTVPFLIVVIYSAINHVTFWQYERGAYLWIFLGGCFDVMACTFNVLAY
jgi:uncharacterized membrane protein YdcZ (DUF606 family)